MFAEILFRMELKRALLERCVYFQSKIISAVFFIAPSRSFNMIRSYFLSDKIKKRVHYDFFKSLKI